MDAETLPGCDPTAARERFALLPPGSGRLEECSATRFLRNRDKKNEKNEGKYLK